MAQTGYTPIILLNSTTTGNTPTTSNLAVGELAINVTDGKLFFNQSGTIKVLANATYATSVSTISFGTTGLTPSTATNGVVTVAGTLAIANGGTNATATPTAGTVAYGTGTAYAFTSAGTTGQVLTSNGSSAPTWSSGGSVAGSNTQVQYNNSGAFGASANFTYTGGTLSSLATTSSAFYSTADAGYAIFDGASNSSGSRINITAASATDGVIIWGYNSARTSYTPLRYGASQHQWLIGSNECMRLDNSGYVGIGCTVRLGNGGIFIRPNITAGAAEISWNRADTASSSYPLTFYNASGITGSISFNNTTTSFNTSSDYRLKNTIAPMAGALAKVALLKPCTYKWNVDGSDGQGFIAHELAEIVPQCVTGEKDAVDANGKPAYQGIDTSFLVATLTSAIQELSTLITAQQSTIQSLTERITKLENK